MIPILDSIPANAFILGTSLLAGAILFLILWMAPEEEKGGQSAKK